MEICLFLDVIFYIFFDFYFFIFLFLLDSSFAEVCSNKKASEVVLSGRHFLIPEAYSVRPLSGQITTVNLVGVWPSLAPYGKELASDHKICRGWCNKVLFSLSRSASDWHFSKFTRELQDWRSQSDFNVDVARKSYSGLKYVALVDKRLTSLWGIYPEAGYYFNCDPDRVPYPSCNITGDYDGALYFRIVISKDYVTDVPKIVASVKAFFLECQLKK